MGIYGSAATIPPPFWGIKYLIQGTSQICTSLKYTRVRALKKSEKLQQPFFQSLFLSTGAARNSPDET